MDISKLNRLLTWTVLILVVLNIGTMGLLWYQHFKKPPPPPDSQTDRDARFAKELGLDQPQADSVRILRIEHFRKTDSIMFEISRTTEHVMNELFASSSDTVLVRQLSDEIGRMQVDLQREVFEHFDRIKRLCGPEQHERLRQLLLEALRAKQPPPPAAGRQDPNHRPPPDGHRPPPPENGRRPPGR